MDVLIGERRVGDDQPILIVAEVGFNHNGDPKLALEMVRAAATHGAGAVKFQTFVADRWVSRFTPTYGVADPSLPKTQRELYRRYELPLDAYAELVQMARTQRVLLFSTPFDQGSADFLETLGVPAFKIASGDLTHHRLLRHAAEKGKPIILSTGMATLGEVETAVRVVTVEAGNPNLILLHCTSSYPCEATDANVRAVVTLRSAFGVPVGFSDHTRDNLAAILAAALGACVIEKHFTTDRNLPGVDQHFSMDPPQLAALSADLRVLRGVLGDGRKQPRQGEAAARELARRSLVAACDIAKGTALTPELIDEKRPGTGLPPEALQWVVGRHAKVDIAADTLITSAMI